MTIDAMAPPCGMLLAAASSSSLFTPLLKSRAFSLGLAAAAAVAASVTIVMVLRDDGRVTVNTSDSSDYM